MTKEINNDETQSKTVRLRRAILGLPIGVKVPTKLTVDHVMARWPLLMDSGLFADKITDIANADSVSDEMFTRIMKSLNSYS